MKQINYPQINETVYHEVLDNGLNIFLLPKPGFHKTYATLSTSLGSLTTHIRCDDYEINLPEGIAHFLEHKLFEKNGVDVSLKFAMLQAQVNAYTQNNRTTYLFSCTNNFKENLALLFDFVLHPEFTEKGIEKEKTIIAQEIKMYEDDAGSSVYMGIIRNLFKEHPIRNEILGSIDSINKINKDLLVKTHQIYYHPQNMVLFVAGNIDVEDTIANIKKLQKPLSKNCIQDQIEVQFDESNICNEIGSMEKDILVPNFLFGIKFTTDQFTNLMKQELAMSVLIDLLLGKSSENYKHLLEQNLINDSFGMDITLDKQYAYFIIGSETNYPDELYTQFKHIFQNIKSLQITEEDFLKTKKQTLGSFVQALNSLEYIANNFIKYHYLGGSLFDILQISKDLSIEDVTSLFPLFENENMYSRFTIYPKKGIVK